MRLTWGHVANHTTGDGKFPRPHDEDDRNEDDRSEDDRSEDDCSEDDRNEDDRNEDDRNEDGRNKHGKNQPERLFGEERKQQKELQRLRLPQKKYRRWLRCQQKKDRQLCRRRARDEKYHSPADEDDGRDSNNRRGNGCL